MTYQPPEHPAQPAADPSAGPAPGDPQASGRSPWAAPGAAEGAVRPPAAGPAPSFGPPSAGAPLPGGSWPTGGVVPPVYPGPPGAAFAPGAVVPGAPRRRGRTPLIVAGAVAVGVLLCAGAVTAVVVTVRNTAQRVAAADRLDGIEEPVPPAGSAPARPLPRTSQRPQRINGRIGDTLTLKADPDTEIRITVGDLKTRSTGCGEFHPKPDSGGIVHADVTVEVVRGSLDMNPFAFDFITSDGRNADVALGGDECGKELRPHDMQAGDKRAGVVVYDVSPAKGAIVFQSLDGLSALWAVD